MKRYMGLVVFLNPNKCLVALLLAPPPTHAHNSIEATVEIRRRTQAERGALVD